MTGRPYLLENLSQETTHAAALAYLVGDIPPTHPLAIASGYVNLAGLHHLAAIVDPMAAHPGFCWARRLTLVSALTFPLQRFERALASPRGERDFARFPPSRAARTSLKSTGGSEPVQIRARYITRFLHGKAYLFGTVDDGRAALVSSANLTGPDYSVIWN